MRLLVTKLGIILEQGYNNSKADDDNDDDKEEERGGHVSNQLI